MSVLRERRKELGSKVISGHTLSSIRDCDYCRCPSGILNVTKNHFGVSSLQLQADPTFLSMFQTVANEIHDNSGDCTGAAEEPPVRVVSEGVNRNRPLTSRFHN